MIIYGSFKDIDGNTINVVFNRPDYSGSDREIGISDGLYFSDDPVNIDSDVSSTTDVIVKTSATISIITPKYLGSYFFATNPRQIYVTVSKVVNSGGILKDEGINKIVFFGFVQPQSYSQPWINDGDTLDISCIDVLSTMSEFNYKNTTASTYDLNKSVSDNVSLYNIITDSLKIDYTNFKSYYKTFYQPFGNTKDASRLLSSTVRFTATNSNNATLSDNAVSVMESLKVNEIAIYGDSYDDIWTSEDCVTNILRYLGLHIRQEGNIFNIFSWSAYRLNSVNPVTVSPYYFMDSNTNLTINETYSQITVKDDIKYQEDVITSPLEQDDLYSPYSRKIKHMTEYIAEGSGDKAHNALVDMVQGRHTSYDQAYTYDWYIQPMLSKMWKFNGIEEEMNSKKGTIQEYLIPYWLANNPLKSGIFSIGSVKKKSNADDNSLTSSINMSNYLYISINGNENDQSSVSPTESDIQKAQPVLTYTGVQSGGSFSPVDSNTTNYLVFSGKFLLQPIVYETAGNTSNRLVGRTNSYTYIQKNGFKKSEGSKAQVPDYSGYGTIFSSLWGNNLVKSDNNKEGRYYTRRFYTSSEFLERTDGTVSLQPWTEDKSAHGYEYKYTAAWNSTDHIYKVPILECEMKIGDKYCVETQMDTIEPSSYYDTDNTKFEWLTKEEIKKRTDLQYTDDSFINDEWHDGTTAWKHTFSLGFNPKIGDNIIGDEYDIQNNIDYKMNLDTEGTAIPIKLSDNLTGNVEFKILGPVNGTWNDIYRRHPTFFRHTKWTDNFHYILSHTQNIIIKDFECKIYSDNAGNTISKDKDLIYTTDDSYSYQHKMDDIDFKICTQLTSQECVDKGVKSSLWLNSVLYGNSPLRTLKNSITGYSGKPEEIYLKELYDEFHKPRIEYTMSYRDNIINIGNCVKVSSMNKNFYVIGTKKNLKMDSVEYHMKESM